MKKRIVRILALLMMLIIGGALFAGCLFFQFSKYDPDDGFDDPNDYVEPDYAFAVSCTENKTTVALGNIGYYGDKAKLVYLKSYEYLYGEEEVGIAEETAATPTTVCEYECGTEATYSIDRYTTEGYDTVYCKFYVISDDGEILAGPVYATEIAPLYDHEEVVQTTGIKGVFTDWGHEKYIKELGCEHTETNFLVSGMIVPLETVDENTGAVTPIQYEEHLDENGKGYIIGPYGEPQNVESYYHNGKKYYFRTTAWNGFTTNLYFYDDLLSSYTRDNIKVTLIVLLRLYTNQYEQPYFLTYEAARTSKTANYSAINTSNAYGAEYWAAFTEFIARRYSQEESAESARYGSVETYVLGNEIDQSSSWNNIVDTNKHEPLTAENYAVEYERMLRITNQSFKKVYARNVALISFTHFWNGKSGKNDYAPKELFDYVSAKTKREGNYDWGLAAHPYGADLTITNFWNSDQDASKGVTGSLNTTRITWSNLEVLQLYLEQPVKLCNGNVRSVYVTEGGVSSGNSAGAQFAKTRDQQAAGVAYAYIKCTQLPCIKAINYYRLHDHPDETVQGIYFGLLTVNGVPKPSYNVYKFIDTQYSDEVLDAYLEYIEWTKNENGSLVYYGTKYNTVFEWKDTMPLFISLFDWDTRWDASKIVVRHSDEMPY